MAQPMKQCPRTATVAWCAAEAAPTLMALGSSAKSAAGIAGGEISGDATLDFASFDLSKPGSDMNIVASIKTERRFASLSWGMLGVDTGVHPYGILAGGCQDGVVSIWNPHAIVNSRGADSGLIHSSQVHQGTVNCVQFHPIRPELMATCGDSQVNIVALNNPSQPAFYPPSETNKHAGSEVLCCAWNRKVQHILCSCSNTGTTVVWDLKQKKEVISFQDPANRQRISGVEWHPEVPTQLIVAYDDDRQPAIQMWDLRNCTYPFKETAGHSKGILGIAWNTQDPNLIMSCGKDNRLICWSNSEGKMDTFCEMSSQQYNFEVKWAPHKPSIISAASYSGSVSIHSVQQQQNAGTKYCPRWYRKPCGVSFGFGGKMMSFGVRKAAAALATDAAKTPVASFCHSLVVPNEPEVVPSADLFESWIGERKLRDYCQEKTRRCGNPHETLMWELMGTQFEDGGRSRVPILLGFDKDRILKDAEGFLGKQPGTTLMGPPPEEKESQQAVAQPAPSLGPELDLTQAESFFDELTSNTEQKKREDEEREQKRLMEQALGTAAAAAGGAAQALTDWSAGPEAIIKQSILVGNLPAAVECCFQSGRMAEALLLASGGGTTLWTRARDEFLRLQADSFLSTVGNIMTNDFEKLVASSNLSSWKETLAIIATYSGDQYQILCEQLADRLQNEKFDPRSALICHICARNFPKTVSIWAQAGFSAQGSQKLALQDLVEKMTVLQEATKFNQPDPLFNAKVTQYAEILANSGRLTAAMRYLCLLQHDASSAILRDRIYNSAPMQMSQLFGARPSFPFEQTDVRIMYQQQPQQQPQQQQQQYNMPGAASHPGMPKAPATGPSPVMPPSQPGGMPPRPSYPGASMPPTPGPGGYPMGPGAPMPGSGMPSGPPAPAPGPPGPGMGPAPRMPGPGMGPAPNMPSAPSPGMPGMSGPGMGPAPSMPGPGMGPAPSMPGPGMGPAPHMPGPGMGPAPHLPAVGHHGAAPAAGPGVLPPGQATMASPTAGPPAGGPPRVSTAPQHSAAPVVDGTPVPWPLPTRTQQKLSTTSSVAGANQAVQERSAGAGVQVGDPMAPHELSHIKGVLSMLIDANSQDGTPASAKRREDISKRLEELYSMLANGQIRNTAAQKVLQMVKAVEAQDYGTANKMQTELCKMDWDANRNWLMVIRRLIPQR
mmetsp:Transcript_44420/g.128550  ORF Transcript_44420/g.128550 Transcript_44420/m.128550 type:complete len:1175 (+) Transcript_44420:84-3608(+)